MRKKAIYQIIKECARLKSDVDKVNYLRQHDSVPLQHIMQLAHDSSIKWALPEGTPRYKPFNGLDADGRLYSETRRLYLFLEGGNSNLTRLKRESLFIQLLESLDAGDAELICNIKEGKFPKAINRKIVNLTWPGLIKDEQEQQA